MLSSGHPDEVVVAEPFAQAHGLAPGDSVTVILDGTRRRLDIVGIALSPEFVYAIAPGGLMPDDRRFGVFWMGRKALAAAFDLDGSFNAVSLALMRGTAPESVVERLDLLLASYGGTGAFARKDQVSNWFLQNEIEQQKSMASILPTIFLAVAAFLANMVMARLIATERGEIGLLKAFGYSGWAVGWHYVKLVCIIAGVGILIGFAGGAFMGRFTTQLYAEFYRFPFLLYRPGPAAFAIAAAVGLAALIVGSLAVVLGAARLPPAEAMRPPAPPMFRRGLLARSRLGEGLDLPTRMVLRHVVRWPARSLLTAAGVAMSVAVLVMAMQWLDSIDHVVDVFFHRSQHQDATVALGGTADEAVVRALAHLPGVVGAEPFRAVAARLAHGGVSRREAIIGVPPGARLGPVVDARRGPIDLPPEGLVLSTKLAALLGVGPGDIVEVEVLEDRRPVARVAVAATFETYIGTPARMDLSALNRLMGEGHAVSGAHLAVDAASRGAFAASLKEVAGVAAVMFRAAALDAFHDTMARTLLIYVGFFLVFSSLLAFGVVYNSARIALSEEARELATLRVIGFTRWEVSYILLGGIAFLTVAALPLGAAAGLGLGWVLAASFDTELFRVPLVVEGPTLGLAALAVLAATILCAAVVRRRLDRLDLVAVLKTRE
jgi:putative ABC transport system permease protein